LISGSCDGTILLWRPGLLFLNVPVEQLTPENINWSRHILQSQSLPGVERWWLEYILALYHFYHYHDVEIGERTIQVGEFDIEIENPHRLKAS
jgi:hypothetical protein